MAYGGRWIIFAHAQGATAPPRVHVRRSSHRLGQSAASRSVKLIAQRADAGRRRRRRLAADGSHHPALRTMVRGIAVLPKGKVRGGRSFVDGSAPAIDGGGIIVHGGEIVKDVVVVGIRSMDCGGGTVALRGHAGENVVHVDAVRNRRVRAWLMPMLLLLLLWKGRWRGMEEGAPDSSHGCRGCWMWLMLLLLLLRTQCWRDGGGWWLLLLCRLRMVWP